MDNLTQKNQIRGLFNSKAVFNAFTHEFFDEDFSRKIIFDLLHSGVPACPACGFRLSRDIDFSRFYGNKVINCRNCSKKWRASSGTVLAGQRICYSQLILLCILREFGLDPKTAAAFLGLKTRLIRKLDRKIGLERNATGKFIKKSPEELLQLFIDDCVVEDPQAETGASDLYDRFKQWHKNRVAWPPMSQKRFGKLIGNRYCRVKAGIYRYIGIGLIDDFDKV